MQKVISWNVNGIRASEKKGFYDYLKSTGADVFCVQETKAHPDQLKKRFIEPVGYHSYWASAEKKGYSGVAIYSKVEPKSVEFLGEEAFDNEGRVLIAEFEGYVVLNCYFPNSQEAGKRIDYKIAFCDAILERCQTLAAEGKQVLLCGDYNVAHKAIDLANPKRNEKNPGYLPEERAWMDKFTTSGFVDTFRMFNQEPENYTWWSYRFKAREKNVGWRIDYHCVNEGFKDKVITSTILSDVMGSDHCPVCIELDI